MQASISKTNIKSFEKKLDYIKPYDLIIQIIDTFEILKIYEKEDIETTVRFRVKGYRERRETS